MSSMELFLAASLLAMAPSSGTGSSTVELRCGEYCLAVAMKAVGIPLESLKPLDEALGQPSPQGYSMEQLEQAARRQGAHTLAVQTSLENLAARDDAFACIALLDSRSHYICIYDVDDSNVYIADPPAMRIASRQGFEALWDGKALLIAKTPLNPSVSRSRGMVPTVVVMLVAGTLIIVIATLLGRLHKTRIGS